MLIVFPFGLLAFSIICYTVFPLAAAPVRRTVSLYSMGGGIIGGIVAAVPGTIDFLTFSQSRVSTIAMTHRISNTVALTIFAISLMLSIVGEGHTPAPFILSLCGLVPLGLGGWPGGSLVYEPGVGVAHTYAEELTQQHA